MNPHTVSVGLLAQTVGRSLFAIVAALAFFQTACNPGHCQDGTCVCEPGSSCDFPCEAPPCHVDCAGGNAECIGDCANGECNCGPDSNCDFICQSEPCHVACTDSSCEGECGNGDCTCEEGSDCTFTCKSGPCHVLCEGNHERCDGQCANGSCVCGENSSCQFECTDASCSFACAAGSECVARCPGGTPGSQGCNFTQCAAGTAELCPDGKTLVCGTECPPADDDDSDENG